MIVETDDLAYLTGLIIGDWTLTAVKEKRDSIHWCVQVGSSRRNLPEIFALVAHRSGFNPLWRDEERIATFPNDTFWSEIIHTVRVNSRELYDYLRPFKHPDFIWTVPQGRPLDYYRNLLSGLFDAKGWATQNPYRIGIASKHRSNLEQLETILAHFGILDGKFSSNGDTWILIFFKRSTIFNFAINVGFRLSRTVSKLDELITRSKEFWAHKKLRECEKRLPEKKAPGRWFSPLNHRYESADVSGMDRGGE
jgi:hypothetical protein